MQKKKTKNKGANLEMPWYFNHVRGVEKLYWIEGQNEGKNRQ